MKSFIVSTFFSNLLNAFKIDCVSKKISKGCPLWGMDEKLKKVQAKHI
jgi:hypothetical protein